MFLLSKYVKFAPTESFEKINHSLYIRYFYITVQKGYDRHIFIEEFVWGLTVLENESMDHHHGECESKHSGRVPVQ